MADVITAFETVKESVNRASTVEEMRTSIVDSFGALIDQMKERAGSAVRGSRRGGRVNANPEYP